MRMRGKSRSQLTVRDTCKAYSGIDHVLVLVNVNDPENFRLFVTGTFTFTSTFTGVHLLT